MREEKWYCDRCACEVQQATLYVVSTTRIYPQLSNPKGGVPIFEYDLCSACKDDLGEWIATNPDDKILLEVEL